MTVESTLVVVPEAPMCSSVIYILSTWLLVSTTIALLALFTPLVIPVILLSVAKSIVELLPASPKVIFCALSEAYESIVTSPDVVPASSVLTNAKWSEDSSQIIPTFLSVPLSTIKPASAEAEAVVSEERTIRGSFEEIFSVLIIDCVPVTVKLPLIVTSPEVTDVAVNAPVLTVPDVSKLLVLKLIWPAGSLVVILVSVTVTLPNLEPEAAVAIPLEVTVVATTSPFAPYTTAEPELTNPACEPFNRLNSTVLEVTPSNLLISFASAVIATLPITILFALRTPSTATWVAERVTKSLFTVVFCLKPILAPFIVTLSTCILPEVNEPVVEIGPSISILVKPLIIEPTESAPTEPNVVLPVLRAYLDCATDSSIFKAILAPIGPVVSFTLLIFAEVAVTRTPPNLRPALVPLCEIISNTSPPVIEPILIFPWLFWVRTFPSCEYPKVVNPSIKPNSLSLMVVVPTIRSPDNVADLTDKLPVVVILLSPNDISPDDVEITAPLTVPVRESVPTSAESDVNFPVTVVSPTDKVPVVDKFWAENPIPVPDDVMLPSPMVILPITEFLAAVNLPVNVPSPEEVISPTSISPAVISPTFISPVVTSSFEPKLIEPSLLVIEFAVIVVFPITAVPVTSNVDEVDIVPEESIEPLVTLPNVALPTESVPVVDKFAAAKSIALLADTILPLENVKFPNTEPPAAVTIPLKVPLPEAVILVPEMVVNVEPPADNVPLVDKLLEPNVRLLFMSELVILPSEIVTSPICEPEAAEICPVRLIAPVTVTSLAVISPVVFKELSDKLIVLVVSEVEITVSVIVILPILDPDAVSEIPVAVNVVAWTFPAELYTTALPSTTVLGDEPSR